MHIATLILPPLLAAAAIGLPGTAHAAEGDGNHHVILLRACVVESSGLVGPPINGNHGLADGVAPGGMVDRGPIIDIIAQANDLWAPANISWFLLAAGNTSDVPVIADPSPVGFKLGDITTSGFGGGEAFNAAQNCATAWEALGEDEGIIFVVARDVIGSGNYVYGVTDGISPALMSGGSDESALCNHPRTLLATDLPWYVVVDDPSVDAMTLEHSAEVWAHELGHVLMLGHGDGLDQAPLGAALPNPGPRRYDDYCDPGETNTGASLMSANMATVVGNPILTPLQIETARAASALAPLQYTTCAVGRPSSGINTMLALLSLVLLGAGRRRRPAMS